MARTPMPAAVASGMPPNPTGGAGADPGTDDTDAGGGEQVVCTICKGADGTYMVYAGDESDGADMSADDAGVMGGGGGGGSGQPADGVGAALKAAMDILQADKSSEGGPGDAEDQFNAGFNGDKTPMPAAGGMTGGMRQKY